MYDYPESDYANEYDEIDQMIIIIPNKFISYMFSRNNWKISHMQYIGFDGIGTINVSENITTICYWTEKNITYFKIINSSWNYNLEYKIEIPDKFEITLQNINSIEIFFDNIEDLICESVSDKLTPIPILFDFNCSGEWI